MASCSYHTAGDSHGPIPETFTERLLCTNSPTVDSKVAPAREGGTGWQDSVTTSGCC